MLAASTSTAPCFVPVHRCGGRALRPGIWPDLYQGQHLGRSAAARGRARAVIQDTSLAAGGTQQQALLKWLKDHGLPEQRVVIQEIQQEGQALDVTVADGHLEAGTLALRVPEHLVITLDRIFEDEAVAELLTTNKLSELACLALYLMYEKKNGRKSIWYDYIKELDRVQGRGQMGAKTPLLWAPGEVATFLQGSPLVGEVQERLKGIEREYNELDTVWFMAGSLFRNYPYDVPTEAFSLELFKQAFAAVQASTVHLQGVPLSKRFALVPLGPPLLSYSSTAKALLRYDAAAREVVLAVDRAYAPGERVYAWCGPQPNRRLLLNYGLVDEANPHDRVALTVTLPQSDALYQAKRAVLTERGLATQQAFQLAAGQDLPPELLPYLRLAFCTDEATVRRRQFDAPVSPENERIMLYQLAHCLQRRLKGYRRTIMEEDALIASPDAEPREKVAARLLRIEKAILQGAMQKLIEVPGAVEACDQGLVSPNFPHVRLA